MLHISPKNLKILSVLTAFAGLVFIYLHHFHNDFQLDDPYFIQDNAAIRSLKNIPSFFTDSRTQASIPVFQDQYRPFFILSLALDYYIANGINPYIIHLHTFIGFVFLLVLCFLFNIKIFRHLSTTPFFPALLATCIFAYHPVTADVVNYMTARSNIFATLYGMLYIITWLYVPLFRKYYLYLIPLIVGCLFKIIAVMFVPLLWMYIIFFEYETGLNRSVFTVLKSSFRSILPAFCTIILTTVWIGYKSLPTAQVEGFYKVTRISYGSQLLTQIHVVFKYFLLFVVPEDPNPYGRDLFITSPFNYSFLIGLLFVIAAGCIIYLFSLSKDLRAISYGMAWFFICLIPTSILLILTVPYVEYYMFPTMIGLSMALAWGITLIANRLKQQSRYVLPVIVTGCLVFLTTLVYGSRERVRIWGNQKAMLEDVIAKDPTSGPTYMNLGVYFLNEEKLDSARDCFNRAFIYWPDNNLVYINLGILSNISNDTVAADSYFQKGLKRNDYNHYLVCFNYASFLHMRHRDGEAISMLDTALAETPSYTPASDLLNQILHHTKAPGIDSNSIADLEKMPPSVTNYTNLSLAYFSKKEYPKSIDVCYKIIALDSNSAIAYNNICAAYNAMHQWDDAIKAGNKALKIKPDFKLAQNNLNFAITQKRDSGKR